MNTLINNLPLCLDANPDIWGFFDIDIAPPLLFYSYMPILLISVLLGLMIFHKRQHSPLNRSFFGIMLAFMAWVVLILIQWTAVHLHVVHFAWQALIFFEFSIYVLSIYFCYFLIYKKDLSNYIKNLLFLGSIALIILIPTKLNVQSFDLTHCEGIVGILWDVQYIFEVVTIVIISSMIIDGIRSKKNRIQSAETIISFGVAIFLLIFFLSNFFGEITKFYDINLIGPIGMIFLFTLMSYAIIRYQSLNLKFFGSQILVITQLIFISSLFFIQSIYHLQIIVGVTLLITVPLGLFLINSVKREIEQREKIEKLAIDLEKANKKLQELDQMKTEFLSLATHQIRAPLTAIKGYASMLIEGDFGILPEKAKYSSEIIEKSCQNLIDIVNEFLDISRIEQGRMVYNKEKFLLNEIIRDSINESTPNISKSNISIIEKISKDDIYVYSDKNKLKQVVTNIIDNAIKYAPKGSIEITLSQEEDFAKLSIKDNGIGIEKEDMKNLFSKFKRNKNALKVNVIGTGLGLYIAQKMINDLDGKIEVKSEGLNKGAEFIIKLKINQ